MSRRWKELYETWKRHHPGMSDDARRSRVQACVGKFAYPNFLAVLLACISLTRDKGGRNSPYFCEICGKHHVGRIKSNPIFPKEG